MKETFFKITIPLNSIATRKIGPNNVAQDVAQDVAQSIIKLVSLDNKISQQKMAEKIGVSKKTIERQIKKMSNIKYVRRGYSGHWEILKTE